MTYGRALLMSVSLFRFLWLAQRKARGGNKKQSFVDGWIEFADKGVAKSVAKMLNCRPMGGKSTSFYSADIWNLKCDCEYSRSHFVLHVR